MRLRKRRRHAAKHPPIIENPQTNAMLRRKAASPWAVIGLYVLNIIILVLIMMLFGYQSQFSDYLNSRGKFADRARNEQQQYLCELISELHDGPAGQLQDLSRRLKCANGPLPPLDNEPSSSSSVPIAPDPGFFTGSPTPGSQVPTGTVARGNGGRESPTRDQGPSGGASRSSAVTTTEPPAATSPAAGGSDPTDSPTPPGIRLCIPLTAVCVG